MLGGNLIQYFVYREIFPDNHIKKLQCFRACSLPVSVVVVNNHAAEIGEGAEGTVRNGAYGCNVYNAVLVVFFSG